VSAIGAPAAAGEVGRVEFFALVPQQVGNVLEAAA
jgi:hypothetical protein